MRGMLNENTNHMGERRILEGFQKYAAFELSSERGSRN